MAPRNGSAALPPGGRGVRRAAGGTGRPVPAGGAGRTAAGGRGAAGGRAARPAPDEWSVRLPPGGRPVRLPPVRRARRPWYRTRAFRLTRTAVLAATLVTGGVWSAQEGTPSGAVSAAPGGAPEAVAAGAFPGTAAAVPGSSPDAAPAARGGASGVVDGEAWRADRVPGATADARGPEQERPRPPASPSPSSSPVPSSPSDRSSSSRGPARSRPPGPPPSTPSGRPSPHSPVRPGAARPTGRPPASARPQTAPRPRPPSPPTRLRIPYLDIDAPVMSLRLDRAGRLPAPPEDDTNLVGWYAGGPAPGEKGTAVAVGHLDTDTDRAVFWGLSALEPGHPVEVRRADGRVAVYTVDALRTYEKAHFPNQEVYGDRGRAELRIITCGGAFDRRTGYAGNLVVFAHLVTVREPGRTRPPA